MDHLTCGVLAGVQGVSWTIVAAVLAAAVIVIGSGLSIARIARGALESIARQPEAGSRAFSAMVIAAALIEGVTFFALLVCFLTVFWER